MSNSSVHKTVRIPIWMDDIIQEKEIKFNRLVVSLLRQYFLNDGNKNISKELIRINELENKLKEIENSCEQLSEIRGEIDDLKPELEERQQILQSGEEEELMNLIKEEFADINTFEELRMRSRLTGKTEEQLIDERLGVFTRKHHDRITFEKSKELFNKTLPGIWDKLQSKNTQN